MMLLMDQSGAGKGGERESKQTLALPSKMTRFHVSESAKCTAHRMVVASARSGEQGGMILVQTLRTSPL